MTHTTNNTERNTLTAFNNLDTISATESGTVSDLAAVAAESIKCALDNIRVHIERRTTRGAWSHGVEAYALEMLEEAREAIREGWADPADLISHNTRERLALNGADSWSQYSWGGCSLIYNEDIARRLCCPSELRKTHNGERRPNAREEWLDTQARALFQAFNRFSKACAECRYDLETAAKYAEAVNA